jgi:hypothetical protein
VLDSVFTYGDVARADEAEFVYYRREMPNVYLRVLASGENAKQGVIRYPPVLDRQPCRSETIAIAGKRAYYAFDNEEVGPHEVVFQAHGRNVMLLTKPASGTNRSWFVDLITPIVDAAAMDR